MALIEKLEAIGDAIRAKTGGSSQLSLDDMVTEIGNISGGGNIPEIIYPTVNYTGWDSPQLDLSNFNYNGVLDNFNLPTIYDNVRVVNGGTYSLSLLFPTQIKLSKYLLGNYKNSVTINLPTNIKKSNIECLIDFSNLLNENIDYTNQKFYYPNFLPIALQNLYYLSRQYYNNSQYYTDFPDNLVTTFSQIKQLHDKIYEANNTKRTTPLFYCYNILNPNYGIYKVFDYSQEPLKSMVPSPSIFANTTANLSVETQGVASPYQYVTKHIFGNPGARKKMLNIPVYPNAGTNVYFLNSPSALWFYYGSSKIPNITEEIQFEMEDENTPKTATWFNQTLYMCYNTTSGVCMTSSNNYVPTGWTYINTDALYRQYKGQDNVCYSIAYSQYNHDAALRTIKSLPDCSAYITAHNKTANKIRFCSNSGSATEAGAISTLTTEEIAIATDKGWTVVLV